MRRCSGKANKLRYIHTIRGTLRDIAIKERESLTSWAMLLVIIQHSGFTLLTQFKFCNKCLVFDVLMLYNTLSIQGSFHIFTVFRDNTIAQQQEQINMYELEIRQLMYACIHCFQRKYNSSAARADKHV